MLRIIQGLNRRKQRTRLISYVYFNNVNAALYLAGKVTVNHYYALSIFPSDWAEGDTGSSAEFTHLYCTNSLDNLTTFNLILYSTQFKLVPGTSTTFGLVLFFSL